MMKYIEHGGNKYPSWQASGNAARWIMPLALELCNSGNGIDVGCSKKEWAHPNAFYLAEPALGGNDALNLPVSDGYLDWIFSSHMLEHLKGNWADCLDYWLSKIKDGGVLFLYLPHSSQTYWHPTSNRKHIHSFDSTEIKAYLQSLGYDPYVTPVDYNNSFAVICYKTKVDKFADFKEQWAEAMGFDTAKGNDKTVMSEVSGANPFITPLSHIEAHYNETADVIWYKGRRYSL